MCECARVCVCVCVFKRVGGNCWECCGSKKGKLYMWVCGFCLAVCSYKTLGQHPGATSHPIRAFKLVNIVYHTTCLTPIKHAGKRDGNRERPEGIAFHLGSFSHSLTSRIYIPPSFKTGRFSQRKTKRSECSKMCHNFHCAYFSNTHTQARLRILIMINTHTDAQKLIHPTHAHYEKIH